jgi:hypothetical protein
MHSVALAALLAFAPLLAARAAEVPTDPAALLRAWAEAYATNEGPRAAALYTEDARLWGSVSRQQTVGREAIADYFGRVRPGATAIAVRFGEHAVREEGGRLRGGLGPLHLRPPTARRHRAAGALALQHGYGAGGRRDVAHRGPPLLPPTGPVSRRGREA